jgi:hypothetical protein
MRKLCLVWLGVLAAACGGDDGGGECTDGMTSCGGACVDTDTNASHCGACGNACPDGVCAGGACGGGVDAGEGTDAGGDVDGGGGDDAGPPPSECPADPPEGSDPCAGFTECSWLRCPGEAFYEAVCDGTTWTVGDQACMRRECGADTCPVAQLCVQVVGGAEMSTCVANPCGTGPITPDCACGLCPTGAECTIAGGSVKCDTCPMGGCP